VSVVTVFDGFNTKKGLEKVLSVNRVPKKSKIRLIFALSG
jgi:hypothetical protein